jgi:putative membrane protein
MTFLNESDKQRLRAAINDVESKTSGEIVTVIAAASGSYYYYPTLWAALTAILSPLLLAWLSLSFAPLGIVEMQLLVFGLLALLLRWPGVKMRLVPRSVQRDYCARRAHEQFLAQNMHTTRERTGVLLYVSVAERHVELLADAGIHARVPEGTWNRIVDDFTAEVKAGRIGAGFVAAVNAIGQHLATHFPRAVDDRNELPDRLIEL